MRGSGKVFLVLLAAGAGTRMGENKLALAFGGKTPLSRCYETFLKSSFPPERVAVAVSPGNRGEAAALAAGDSRVILAPGGATRGASVKNALSALRAAGAEDGVVAIHDAARCLVSAAVIDAAVRGAMERGSGVAAVPMRDTVRSAAGEIIPREGLLLMQTPQAFDFARILSAYEAAEKNGLDATDDCAVYSAAGYAPHFTEGSMMNQKLTYREDIPFFRAACSGMPRVGFGEDTHVLTGGRRLILGGVDVPYERGLLGHSDADVLIHAVMDALLGAAALGDIGRHFPDTDPRYAGADSMKLLGAVAALLSERGFAPGNVDATVVAERPKLAPHIPAMRENMARALGLPQEQVSVKATTSEKMNDEGAGKCITARAMCTVFPNG